MAETLLPGAIHRQIEFVNGLTGDCGPNMLAMAQAWAEQRGAVDTLGVYTYMRDHSLLDNPNGASNIDELRRAAEGLGLSVVEYRAYGEPWADWRDFFTRHVGTHYIGMETANGQALRDSISGNGENATNLHYHFIGVVGHHDGGYSAKAGRDLPSGWWCVDGDNYAVGDCLQFYPDDVLAAAQPCAALAIAAKAGVVMAGVPAGWHDDGKVLTGPKGEGPVRLGFRDYVLAHGWFAGDVPLGAEAGTGNGTTQQQFRYTTLTWTQATGVVEHDRLEIVEQESQRTQAQNQQLTAQVGTLNGQVTTLNGQVSDLQKQVNGLQVQLAQAQQQQQSAGPQTVAEAIGVLVTLIAAQLEKPAA